MKHFKSPLFLGVSLIASLVFTYFYFLYTHEYPPSSYEKIATYEADKVFQTRILVTMTANTRKTAPTNTSAEDILPDVKNTIAVASGKGGVGKSTTALNLALSLQASGAAVGIMDADVYGPSLPLLTGVSGKPDAQDKRIMPLEKFGLKLMSMGFFIDDNSPVIWRGPMLMRTIQQFVMDVDWGKLDILLVDLPPGTGDAQLSLCQTVPLDGGVIITTPQEASLGVVRKGIGMFEKVNVPILGIVENMSYFTTQSGERVEIFGHGGGAEEATRQEMPFLGEVPLFTEIREGGDAGVPVVVSDAEGAPAQAFGKVAAALRSGLD